MNDYLKKASHPAISWAAIIAAVGLGASGLYSANAVENIALGNVRDIAHEKELRISEQLGIKEDLKELKQDSKDLADTLREETQDIKLLLQQLLLRQAAQPIP